MAVTGPFTRTIGSKKSGFYKTQTWWRQDGPPYRDPLPYSMYSCSYAPPESNTVQGPSLWTSSMTPALDRAYEKFKGKMKEGAELAVNLAERKQSVDMMSKRILQIAKFTKHLKRFEFHQALLTLGWRPKKVGKTWVRVGKHQVYTRKGVDRVPKLKRRSKAFSNNFLEVHFGWSPLIGDIGATVATLQNGVPPVRVHARGRYYTTLNMNYPPGNDQTGQRHKVDVSCALNAYVSVSNPNLWLANQLGFVNPVGVFWELVPFSFVVDWFTNVGSFLSQWTDFVGLNIVRATTTFFGKCDVISTIKEPRYYYPARDYYLRDYYKSDNTLVTRSVGISKPTLQLKPFQGLSVMRGATAIALLLQTMK